MRQDLGHLGQRDEIVEDRRRVRRAEEDVEVADRLGPPAQAAADLGADDLGMLADRLEDRRDQQRAPRVWRIRPPVVSRNAIPSRMLASVLAPKPLSLAIWPGLGRGPEVGQALDLQRLVQDLDLLGPQARHPQQGEDSRRHRLAELVVGGQLPGGRKLDDLREHRLADSRHLRQAAVGDHLREVGRQAPERLGRVVIGPAAKRVLALDLENRPHLIENLGDARGFHGGTPRTCEFKYVLTTENTETTERGDQERKWQRTIGPE